MLKIILILIFSSALTSFAQTGFSSGHNPHDSLLFDGSVKNLWDNCDNCQPDSNCEITVYNVKGSATGTVIWYTMEDISTCGPKEMAKVWHCEVRQLKAGDMLKPGEEITTGSDGEVELRVKIKTGFYIRTAHSVEGVARTDKIKLAPGTTMKPSCPTAMKKGRVWINETMEEAGKQINETIDRTIESVKSKLKPKGTQFTIETNDTEDLIKVYEGSVEVILKKFDDSD